jgi:hypothetical protein
MFEAIKFNDQEIRYHIFNVPVLIQHFKSHMYVMEIAINIYFLLTFNFCFTNFARSKKCEIKRHIKTLGFSVTDEIKQNLLFCTIKWLSK